MRLEVVRARQTPQVREEVVLVSGGEKRRDQDHIGDAQAQDLDCSLQRLDEYEIRAHQFADDPPQDVALPIVRFDCKNERHGVPQFAYALTMNTKSTAPTAANTTSGAFSRV